ncbi:hypothetical protein UNDKW_1991 [Undibacterium sp. KW1]|nr:hypothetical protein UNDKW_1991 [Undibacterium sp. KW1]
MKALLELDVMPAGMELFPAADEDQWDLIRNVINDCDYYVLILGGRYGSIGPEGKSYTEMEYDYAVSRQIPILAFLHKDPEKIPAGKTEKISESTHKLRDFRHKVQGKHCKYWENALELGSIVSRGLSIQMTKAPGAGWVRGSDVPTMEANIEILNLRRHIDALKEELAKTKEEIMEPTADLAQGEDKFKIGYTYREWDDDYITTRDIRSSCSFSWNKIFSVIAPHLIVDTSEDTMQDKLTDFIKTLEYCDRGPKMEFSKLDCFKIDETSFSSIKIQLRALNLICKSEKIYFDSLQSPYWTLTKYGDQYLTKIVAIKRLDAY